MCPIRKRIALCYSKIRGIKRFFPFDELLAHVKSQNKECSFFIIFEKIRVLLNDLKQAGILFNFLDCDNEIIGYGYDGLVRRDNLCRTHSNDSSFAVAKIGRVEQSRID